MNSNRAPKQWSLTKNESITTFEAWRQNLQYSLYLDTNFVPFLADNFTWQKKPSTAPPERASLLMGKMSQLLTNVPPLRKNVHLELMLGQIANFCSVILRNTIVKNSTSVNSIWQAIRAHFGFQSTEAHFLDLSSIKLKVDERPEDLFQQLMSFTEDNLLVANSNITHHGASVSVDEELTPILDGVFNMVKTHTYRPTWSRQTALRHRVEISQAIDSLFGEIRTAADTKVLRTTAARFRQPLALLTNHLPNHGLPKSDQSFAHYVNKQVAMSNNF